jgi:hypothetical protein
MLVLLLGQNQQEQSKFCLNALLVVVVEVEEVLLLLEILFLVEQEEALEVTQGYW